MEISESFSFNEKNSSSVVKIMEEEKAATAAVNWLELPEHISFEILVRLTCFSDYFRFSAVCVQWRSLLFSENCPKLPTQPPLLIVPTPPTPLHKEEEEEEEEEDDDGIGEKKKINATTKTRSCSFYRITDNKVYRQLQLAMPFNRHFYGSGHGWLVTMDDDKFFYSIRLINPFFFPKPCKEIELPSLTTFIEKACKCKVRHCFCRTPVMLNLNNLKKAILSADPISNPKDYIVMVIYGMFKRLAFMKPGGGDKDAAWTVVKTDNENYHGPTFEDIIYYKDKFYALHYYGQLFVCDLEKRIAEKIVEPKPGLKPDQKKYLVEESSSGDLLLVVRISVNDQNNFFDSTIGFKVFKLLFMDDPTGKFLLEYLDSPLAPAMDGIEPEWMEVNDLHGCAIFVGHNGSLSVSAANFPGVKPNCIYYIDSDRKRLQDMGLFNLEDGSIDKHYYPTEMGKQVLSPHYYPTEMGKQVLPPHYYPTEMGKQVLPPLIWIEPPQPWNIIQNK